MKAVVWTAYGGPEVLEVREVPVPVPGKRQVQVAVRATTVTAGDTELRDLSLPLVPLRWPMRAFIGLRRPTRLPVMGMELAGEVTAVGVDVDRFRVGDTVLAHTGMRMGGQAEFACLDADGLVVHKPDDVGFGEAAALPNGGLEAMGLLRKAGVGPGQRVAVVGAGGSIGTMAVQLAAHLGATVTAVDGADKLDLLSSLGAHDTMDFRTDDVTSAGPWDVLIDVPGVTTHAAALDSLTATGTLVVANPRVGGLVRGFVATRRTDRRVVFFTTEPTRTDLRELVDLLAAGTIRVVVDRRYGLDGVVDAHRYVASGRKQGNLVVEVSSAP